MLQYTWFNTLGATMKAHHEKLIQLVETVIHARFPLIEPEPNSKWYVGKQPPLFGDLGGNPLRRN